VCPVSKRRVRHHVNPLGERYLVPRAEPLALPPGEVEVELGCADALFLFERARVRPAATLVGVEIREKLVKQVNRLAAEQGLTRLSAVFANMNVELPFLFPDRSLDRVFINFPDPWFKRRHHNRRVVDPELIESLHRKLRPGGELFFQSDVFDLALDALATLEEADRLFANTAGPWSFLRDNPYGARSLREVRCQERGVRIWRMLYRRHEPV